jgi:RNA polymerase sigma-70 factor (ECF subfamily)
MEKVKGMTDEELVLLSLGNDKEAFGELVLRYYKGVYSFIFLRVGEAMAADLVQESFLKAYQSLRGCKDPRGFSRWLFTIARNVCRRYKRDEVRHRRALCLRPTNCHEVSTVDQVIRKETLQRLYQGLSLLPQDQQLVLTLKHKQRLTCRQIAEYMGKPLGTITSLLSRACENLRKRLGSVY